MIAAVVFAVMVLVIPAVLVLGALAAACLTVAAMAATDDATDLALVIRTNA